jgi:ABC-type sugar transport system permease subunit
MSDLAHSPLRSVAFALALVAILPTCWLILRHMLRLRDPALGRGAQALDVVWTVVPLVAVLLLAGLAAVA